MFPCTPTIYFLIFSLMYKYASTLILILLHLTCSQHSYKATYFHAPYVIYIFSVQFYCFHNAYVLLHITASFTISPTINLPSADRSFCCLLITGSAVRDQFEVYELAASWISLDIKIMIHTLSPLTCWIILDLNLCN